MPAAAPISKRYNNHYDANGFGEILPPDENTVEMAVDCPASYIAAHPPRGSGASTPQLRLVTPPPTPMSATGVATNAQKVNTNLNAAASAVETLPQPDMNFDRIHRMRESARRQKEMRLRDQRLKARMAEERGAEKIGRLVQKTPQQEALRNRKGVINQAFLRDSYVEAPEETPEIDAQQLAVALHEINGLLGEESGELLSDVQLLQQVVQSPNFITALTLSNSVVDATKPNERNQPVMPVTPVPFETIISEVQTEMMYCHLEEASQLIDILNDIQFRSLAQAHDGTSEYLGTTSPILEDIPTTSSQNVVEDEVIKRRVALYTDKEIKIVRIEKTADALGATVRQEEDGSVTISRIVSGGMAEKSGLFTEGDELIEVNGHSMRGLDVNEVGDAIAAMTGNLVFVLASNDFNDNGKIHLGEMPAVLKHVRAMFDYEAFDDPYLPCRELGLSFQKGDILRIMSMDDKDWWQAYRDADDDSHLTLAGLVPSQQFQHQRESLRISMTQDQAAPENQKSLFCGKRKPKAAIYDASEDEPIQTYEEMALYQQPDHKKRPIVLIGPPNVGRHELKQKLIDNDKNRFANVVAHTTRPPSADESHGSDFHFVSIETFEAMKQTEQFIEDGTYQKHLYGTSNKAVEDVIDAGKICVMNLHAESLPTLSASGLMPYIVFIAPPPLEKLRSNMSREGKQLKEEELRNIIENARDKEQRYAHYFDETIRNNDLNRSYAELLRLINKLDSEPQWVPAAWLD